MAHTITATWDDSNNLTAWQDRDHPRHHTSSASLRYDAAGRKTGETITYPGGAQLGYTQQHSPAGLLTRLT
ncbi:hypothetical protein [Chitiniphilus shinanonensis]|uniref:hypothetical protein n=1 Tax=Chitiniphilus shinanonensis TaxID=553088 RepID=UPI003066516C